MDSSGCCWRGDWSRSRTSGSSWVGGTWRFIGLFLGWTLSLRGNWLLLLIWSRFFICCLLWRSRGWSRSFEFHCWWLGCGSVRWIDRLLSLLECWFYLWWRSFLDMIEFLECFFIGLGFRLLRVECDYIHNRLRILFLFLLRNTTVFQ